MATCSHERFHHAAASSTIRQRRCKGGAHPLRERSFCVCAAHVIPARREEQGRDSRTALEVTAGASRETNAAVEVRGGRAHDSQIAGEETARSREGNAVGRRRVDLERHHIEEVGRRRLRGKAGCEHAVRGEKLGDGVA